MTPSMQLGDGFDHAGRAPPLRSHLHRPVVLAGGRDHLLAFPGIVAAWLLDVDVLAGGAPQDRGGAVPVIGRLAEERVHFLVVQNLSEIRDRLRVLLAAVFQSRLPLIGPLGIDIADILDHHARLLLQRGGDLHAAVQPHDPDGHFLAGQCTGLGDQRSGPQGHDGPGGCSQELSA